MKAELMTQDEQVMDNKQIAALEKQGLDESFIAETLKHIATNAYRINEKGDSQEDFATKLRAVQQLVKMKNPKMGQNNINIWIFSGNGQPF